MFPEVSRAAAFVLTMGSIAAGVALVGAVFKVADFAVSTAGAAFGRLRLALAPRCVDCSGKGWRRWRDGDGAPVRGWRDCKLCRGLGRIVEDVDAA